jgi:hypothetical protein
MSDEAVEMEGAFSSHEVDDDNDQWPSGLLT